MKLKKTFVSILAKMSIFATFLISLFAIFFSLSPNVVVALSTSVSSQQALKEALASSVYDEIILSNSITLTNGTIIDGDLDGNGIKKTIRAEVTGTSNQGVVNEDASTYTLFYVSQNATVIIKNCIIKGGGVTAIVNGTSASSTNNNSTLYIDNCSISNSGSTTSAGGGIRNTVGCKAVVTNSSISRNIAKYGAGFQNQQGTFILDNCSVSENRSFEYGGGGGENTGNENKGGTNANMYIVNSTIANNTSQEIGGGINNCKNGNLYVINSIIAGNATTNGSYSGGGIGNNSSTLHCTNSILMDNVYLSASGDSTGQDVYEYSSGTLELDGCVYGSVTGSNQSLVNEVEVDSTCYQASESDSVFASSKTGSIIDENGNQGNSTYNQVVLVEDENGVTYAPLAADTLANVDNNSSYQTVKVEFDYSDLDNIVLKTKDECSESTEAPKICGAGKQLASDEHILTLTVFVNEDFDLSGGTVYGDSYIVSENDDETVTLSATPTAGNENKSVLWAQADVTNEKLTYLSSDNAYEIQLSDTELLNSCWNAEKKSYDLIIQPITLKVESKAKDKSVDLSWSIDYSSTFCKNYTFTNSISSYDVYYSVVNDFDSSSKQFFNNVSGTSTTITGLTNETAYYFFVVARIGSKEFNGNIIGYTSATPEESGVKTYILTSTLESGKQYLIVSRNTAGTGNALTNDNSNRGTFTSVTVSTLSNTSVINVEATEGMLWTYTKDSSSTYISNVYSNTTRYITMTGTYAITATTSRNLTVTATSIKNGNYSLNLSGTNPSRTYGTRNVYFYEVKHPADAPTTITGSIQQRIGEDSGVITGVTTAMEYSTDGLSWNNISGTSLQNMAVGKYFFRYKETALAYASPAVTVEVLEKKLEQINIHTNPKLSYTAKDALDLSSLVVTLVYNDGSTTNVSYADFASTDSSVYQRKNGTIQTSIENGTILECSNNDSRITISLDGLETVTAKMTISHNLEKVLRKEATCTENGNEEYYRCSSCGIMYSDSEGNNRIYTIPTIYSTGHAWGSQVEENRVEPTCTEAGSYDMVIYCDKCHEVLQRQTVTLSPTGHTWGSQVEENRVEPTCDEDGHYDLVIYCTVCHEKLQRQTVTINKLGHDYQNPVWVWDGFTAKYVYTCTRDTDHKLELIATITEETTVEPTCTTTGKKIYTATVEYQNQTFTDTKEETLSALGHKEAEAIEENRVEPTCTTTGSYDEVIYCSICGEELSRNAITLDPLGHDYKNPVWTWNGYSQAVITFTCTHDENHKDSHTATITEEITTTPTCTTTGIKTYTATVTVDGTSYSDTQTEVLPALGHTPAEAVEENRIEPTCENEGSYDIVVYCSVCGEELSRAPHTIEALGHTYGELIVEVPATCTTSGIKAHYHCSVCNEYFDSNKNKVSYDELVIAALGHTPSEAVEENRIEATCENEGSYDTVVYCSVCGEELSRTPHTIEAFGHDYKNPVWTWTGYSQAIITFTCTHDENHKDSHTATITAETTTAPTCTTTGIKTYTATVTVDGTPYSDTQTEVLPALGHTPAESVEENRVEPTCTEKGSYDEVVYCSVCGEELLRETKEIPALGHTPSEAVEENRIEATCENAGSYDIVIYCSVCNHEISREHHTIEALGHEYGELIAEVPATCETTGVKAHYHCSVCNEYFDSNKNKVSYAELIIEALGHSAGEVEIENSIPATCTEAGSYDEVVYCTVCGEVLSRNTINLNPLGHDYQNPVWAWNGFDSATLTFTCTHDENHKDSHTATITAKTTTAPTCTTTGIKTYTATVIVDGTPYSDTQTEVLPALDHTLAEAVEENRVEPTCTEAGSYDLVVYCSVCGEELSRTPHTIEALGHNYGELVAEVPATCTTSGVKAHYHCSECNEYFDSNKNKVSYDELVIAALGHTPSEAVEENRVEPTCTEAGSYDLVVYCSVCGEELSRDTKEIPALGHTPSEAVEENRVEPTCETAGSYDTVIYCSVCSHEISREHHTIEALGHDFDYSNPVWNWDGYTSATVTLTCKNDSNHKDLHNATITAKITTAPTCTTTGIKTYTAQVTVDGHSYTDTQTEVLSALGHTPAEAVEENRVEPTCTEKGSYDEVVYCSVCGEELSRVTKEIPALGHTPSEAVEENRVEPTCTEKGSYDEVVYCSVCGEELSRTPHTIEALGHDYDYTNPVWNWDGYTSATITFTCKNDSNHKDTYNATITSEVTIEPTDTTSGLRVYTATVIVNEISYTNQVNEELPNNHHEITTVYAKAATCEENGNIQYYYCAECDKYYRDAALTTEIEYADTIIPAIGHNYDYNNPVWTWNEYTSATISFTCLNDSNHKDLHSAVITSETTVNPTCETEGLKVYTATITINNKIYTDTKEEVLSAKGHEYGELITEVPATCETTGVKAHYHCSVCGKYFDSNKNEVTYDSLIIEALGHNPAVAVEENRVEPTCTEDGSYDTVVYCSVCGEELSRTPHTIEALGHDYDYSNPVWAWNELESATLTFTCKHDSNHKDVYNISSTNEITLNPTCKDTGIKTYTVSIAVKGKTYTDTKEETIPALGHDPLDAVVENEVLATCDVDGSYDLVVYCSRCGEVLSRNTYISPAFGHDFDYDNPTWVWVGYDTANIVFACKHDANHTLSYVAIISSEIKTPASCEAEGLKQYTATITINNKTYTDTKEETIPALGHHPLEAVKENVVLPTCEADGSYDLVVYCKDCNKELSREPIVDPKLGHDYQNPVWNWDGYTSATITFTCSHDANHKDIHTATITSEITIQPTDSISGEKVYTATVVVLGVTYTNTKTEVLPKLHHYIETVHAKEPTCEEDGNITYYYCADCNIYYSDANLSVEINYEDTIIPALGHIYSDYIEEVLPTCETNGLKAHYHCERCNKYFDSNKNEVSYDSLVINALGHTPSASVEENRIEATCETDGSYDTVIYCSVCNHEISRDHHIIPAFGHDYDVPVWHWDGFESATYIYVCKNDSNHKLVYDALITSVVTIEPTDSTAGERVYTATVTVGDNTYTDTKTEVLPKLHHSIVTVYEKPATCTEAGNITYYYCPDCHIYYRDADLTIEITLADTVIPALGHTPSEAVEENRVEPTCTEPGSYDEVVYCSVCGEELSRTPHTIEALGHTYGELIAEVPATCTTTGVKEHYHCSECNEYFDSSKNLVDYDSLIIPALGHTPSEAVEENRIEPTCETAGSYDLVVYCSVCGEELSRETKEIPALGHTPSEAVEENRVEPTCETAGSYDTVIYCSVCNHEISREHHTIETLGHDFDYDHPVWTWSNYEAATITFTCNHNATHKSSHNATIEFVVTVEPTDTTSGLKVYTATVTVNGTTYTNQKQEVLPKLHHAIKTVYEKAATCTEDGNITYYYCPDCHIYYLDAELTTEITLADTIIPALGHTPSEAVEENRIEATCDTDGSYDLVVYCSRCGEELSRTHHTIEALGHTYGELIAEVPATCTTSGVKAHYHCLVCNEYFDSNKNKVSYDELIIAALGHTPNETVEENRVEPTCTEAGSYDLVVYCSVCGEELSRETKEIPALGHTPSEAVEENRIEPTCETAGSYDTVIYCSVCNHEISREHHTIDALGHDYDYTKPVWNWNGYTSATISFTCSHDVNHKDTYTATITSVVTLEPTDTTTGSKTYTAQVIANGQTYTDTKVEELPVTGHTIEVVYAKAPTCTEAGNITYYYCSECHKYYSDTNLTNEITLADTVIPALGHTPSEAVVENRIEATCETAGSYDLVVYCSRCGEELSREPHTIEALGHAYGELIAEVPATCTTSGVKAHYHCLVCNEYFDSNKNKVSYEELIIAALGHTPSEAVEENRIEPTCETAGSYDLVVYCSVCGEELLRETKEIPALGHTPSASVEENRIEATCETDGSYDTVVYCSVCGKELSRTPHTIEALGHDYDYSNPVWNWNGFESATITFICSHDSNHKDVHNTNISGIVTVEPTDSAAGLKEYTASITIQGHSYTDVKYEVLPKLHHSIVTVYEKAATCTEAGNITYYYCPDCHIYYLDADLITEITLADTVIPALGHIPSEAVVENKIDATCEAAGSYDLVVYCSVCGEELSREPHTIEALGHTYGELIAEVPATCTTSGIKAHYHCLVCNEYFDSNKNKVTYDSLIIEALGHVHGEAQIENEIPATCTETGSYDLVVYCSVCGEELSRIPQIIPVQDHTPSEAVEENRIEATCDTDGSYDLVVYCSVCHHEISRKPYTIDALGHDYDYSNPVWNWTAYSNAKVTLTCKHNANHTVSYDADIEFEVTLQPTDSASGLKKYTATVVVDGHTLTNEKVEQLPKNHHNIQTVHAKEATCDEDGNITYYYCSECNKYYSDGSLQTEITLAQIIIPAFGHTYGELIAEVAATCETSGMKAHYHCSVCGKYFDSNKNEVTYDSLIIEAFGHTNGEPKTENVIPATCTEDGSYDEVVYCLVCGHVVSRHHDTIEAIGHDYQNPVWSWNGFDSATLTFTCSHDANHNDIHYADITAKITVAPTDSSSGLKEYTATVTILGITYTDTKTEELPKNHHTISIVSGTPATCENDGTITYYYCPDCDKYYSDATLQTEITLDQIIIPALGHNPSEAVVENKIDATCEADGSYDLVVYCSRCGEELSREPHTIEASGHTHGELIAEVSATCTTTGIKAHYHCSVCDKYFDSNKKEVTYDSLIIASTGHEEASKVKENIVEATCEADGSYDLVVYCKHCGTVLSRERFISNALGHEYDYQTEEWNWVEFSSSTITFRCKHDHNHTTSYNANISNEIVKEPTCLEDGILRYTASITINGVAYSTTKDKAIPAIGHDFDYSVAVWSWNGFESSTVSFRCKHDSNHMDTYSVSITSQITLEPTCEETGIQVHTAIIELNGITYKDVKEEVLKVLGHDYAHYDLVNAHCESTGLNEHYHCERCNKYFNSNKNEVTYESLIIPVLGHTYGNVIETVEPTGGTTGFTTHYHCDKCNKYFDLDKNEVSYDSLVIPALGYTYSYIVNGKVYESYHGYKGDKLNVPKYPETYEENEVLYRFIGWNKEIPNELTSDIEFVALYRMERIYLKEFIIELSNDLTIGSDYEILIDRVADNQSFQNLLSYNYSDYDVATIYKIKVVKGDEEINLADYDLTIKMKKKYVGELEDDSKLFVLNQNNEIEELEFTIDGDYIVFNTSSMSNFAFGNSNSTMIYLILIIQSLSLGMLILILLIRRFVKR